MATPGSVKQQYCLQAVPRWASGYINSTGSLVTTNVTAQAAYAPSFHAFSLLVWRVQGGPGCASTFGAFYELGPALVHGPCLPGKLPETRANPYSWNAQFGLLLVDQPIGTGYSIAGSAGDCFASGQSLLCHSLTAVCNNSVAAPAQQAHICRDSKCLKLAAAVLCAACSMPKAMACMLLYVSCLF
jgi:hypothetical protein